MDNELFKKTLEFNEALDAARSAKKNVLRAAENVLRTAYEQNGNNTLYFESTQLGSNDEDLIGEYNTLSFEGEELCLSHPDFADLKCSELEWVCYDDLQALVKAVVDAVK